MQKHGSQGGHRGKFIKFHATKLPSLSDAKRAFRVSSSCTLALRSALRPTCNQRASTSVKSLTTFENEWNIRLESEAHQETITHFPDEDPLGTCLAAPGPWNRRSLNRSNNWRLCTCGQISRDTKKLLFEVSAQQKISTGRSQANNPSQDFYRTPNFIFQSSTFLPTWSQVVGVGATSAGVRPL